MSAPIVLILAFFIFVAVRLYQFAQSPGRKSFTSPTVVRGSVCDTSGNLNEKQHLKDEKTSSTTPATLSPSATTQSRSAHSTAVVLHSKSGPYIVVHDWPRPQLLPHEVLIRVKVIGLNPIDWKCVKYGFGVHAVPWISGREAAGVVEAVGSELQQSYDDNNGNGDSKRFNVGDRVWVASSNYRDNRTSTFQEYVTALPYNVGHLPDWISSEQGATLGVGAMAAAGALYDSLGVAWPSLPDSSNEHQSSEDDTTNNDRPWILIWGAACVTGMMAVQLARLSGLRVLAVASPANADKLLRLGATRVLDRNNPSEVVEVARLLGVKLAVDCVGQETATHAVRALSSTTSTITASTTSPAKKAKLAYLVKKPKLPLPEHQDLSTDQEQSAQVEAASILIKRFHEDHAHGQAVVDLISRGLVSGAVQPVPFDVVSGGFAGVEAGLARLEEGHVSARKLVVPV